MEDVMTNSGATKVRDPVCGMDINPDSAAGKSGHAGETYFFCSGTCKQKFDRDPSMFTRGGSAAAPSQEAHQDHGHSCCAHDTPGQASTKDPVCGMTVEPGLEAGSLDHNGQTYLFCSKGCLEKFRAEPTK